MGLFQKAQHPTEGAIVMTQLPLRFSDTKVGIGRMQPKFGEHSRDILHEAGLTESEMTAMFATGAARDGTIVKSIENGPTT